MNADIFEKEVTWDRGETAERGHASSWVPFAVPGSLLGIALVLGLTYYLGRHDAAPPPVPVVAIAPTCPNPSVEIADVERLIRQGQLTLAVGLADSYLGDPGRGPCRADPVHLAGLRYQAALDDLLSNTPAEDGDAARVAAERWRDTEHKADLEQVLPEQREPPMTVFARAYNARLWALARAAFVAAWEQGAVRPADLLGVAKYHATLRNLGSSLLEQAAKGKPTRTEALATLSTGCAIARAYHVGGESCQDLKDELGADERTWPPPQADDPVLQAAMGHPRPPGGAP